MEFLSTIKEQLPDWAKDIRLNLDAVIARSTLPAEDAVGAAPVGRLCRAQPAAGRSLQERPVRDRRQRGADRFRADGHEQHLVSLRGNERRRPAQEPAGPTAHERLRHARRRGEKRFELFALVASIIGKCYFCVQSHYENLKNDGLSTEQLRDAGRIAAVVNAAALALTAQGSKP